MRSLATRLALVGLCMMVVDVTQAEPLGPTPYLSFADSPFYGGTFDYFYLEDFEDHALNTPGVGASAGSIISPGSLTDSVDGDDGVIDGLGQDGHSFYRGSGTSITFTFNASTLGQLPTNVGAVLTDVGGYADYSGYVTLTAYDASGAVLGIAGPALVGDHSANGTTAEDRFLGFRGTVGIRQMTFAMDGRDWEMDHLQYGVPEPATIATLGMAVPWLMRRRRSAAG